MPTTQQVEFINKKEFTKAVLDENAEDFVVYVASFISKITIHPAEKAQIALLLTKKVILPENYLDFANVLSKKSAKVLSERTGINNYIIELQKGKQLSYGPIYSLDLVKLEILKTYIEKNMSNGFI